MIAMNKYSFPCGEHSSYPGVEDKMFGHVCCAAPSLLEFPAKERA